MKAKPKKTTNSWKDAFVNGETFPIKGYSFYVASVTRRGLALRKVKQENKNQEL